MFSVKRIKKILSYLLLAILLFTTVANMTIVQFSKQYLYDTISKVPSKRFALLLGTSKITAKGKRNEYFFNRIDALVSLFRNGKIKYILISGDNSSKSYNEPQDMKDELVKLGIPEENIFLDYAGFRTLDSVIRAKEVFGIDDFIIVSQKFHNQRAVYLARKNKIQAVAYNAKEVKAKMGFLTQLREFFAKDKVFIDFLFGIKPKFLGQKIKLDVEL
jgi:SanA protein